MDSVAEKRCTRCGETKAVEAFRRAKGRPTQPCLDCHRKANAEWRAANPDKMQAARDVWMSVPANAERRKDKEHQRYLLQRDLFNQRSLDWRKTNREQYLKNRKRGYRVNAVRERARSKTWKLKNPEKTRQTIKNWIRKNPDKKRAHDARYRANKNNCAVNDFTAAQWRRLKEMYGGRCAYCTRSSARLEQDHVIPLSRGGNNTMNNMLPACKSCNSRKKDRLLEEVGMRRRIIISL